MSMGVPLKIKNPAATIVCLLGIKCFSQKKAHTAIQTAYHGGHNTSRDGNIVCSESVVSACELRYEEYYIILYSFI